MEVFPRFPTFDALERFALVLDLPGLEEDWEWVADASALPRLLEYATTYSMSEEETGTMVALLFSALNAAADEAGCDVLEPDSFEGASAAMAALKRLIAADPSLHRETVLARARGASLGVDGFDRPEPVRQFARFLERTLSLD